MPAATSTAEATPKAKADGAPYGFLSIHSSLFPAGIHGDLNDLGSAGESLSVDERIVKCTEREEAKFDAGQYQSVAAFLLPPLLAARNSPPSLIEQGRLRLRRRDQGAHPLEGASGRGHRSRIGRRLLHRGRENDARLARDDRCP
jgi:hypothetical protein